MAKLFEEVVTGNALSPAADTVIHFAPVEVQPQMLPTSSVSGASTRPRSSTESTGGNSSVSPRVGVGATSNNISSPSRNLMEASPQSLPSSLRCHSLMLQTQPSLFHTLFPNFGKGSFCKSEAGDTDVSEAEQMTTEGESSPCLTGEGYNTDVASSCDASSKLHEVTVDDEPDVFLELIKFVYLGTCQIEDSNVKALLLVGDRYNIEDIVRQCLQWLQEHFNADIFFSFLSVRLSHFQQLLCQSLLLVLKSRRHFELVTEDSDGRWDQIPVSFLEALLSSDELPVVSEEEVLHLLARWASRALAHHDSENNDSMPSTTPRGMACEPSLPSSMAQATEIVSIDKTALEVHSIATDSGGESTCSGCGVNAHHSITRGRSESASQVSFEDLHEPRRMEMLALLRTFRLSDATVSIAELEPILQILQISGLFSSRPPRLNAAMDPGFVIYRGVAGVNVATPFGHGITQPDVVTHAWKGGSVSLGSHDFLQQQEGFRPSTTDDSGVIFPRLWVRITCPSWSHREKRVLPSQTGRSRHSISGSAGIVTEEYVSTSLMSMPVHETSSSIPSTLKTMQSQDDWDIGPKLTVRPVRPDCSVPNISDNAQIDHKVLCVVISGHMRHGIRIGRRERSSIYEIEDLCNNNQCGDEVCCVGGTPTEIEFELQLSAQAPNNFGICHCGLAVLPSGSHNDDDTLFEIPFDASSEEPLYFHITSNHFDSNSSYSVEMNWVLRPCGGG